MEEIKKNEDKAIVEGQGLQECDRHACDPVEKVASPAEDEVFPAENCENPLNGCGDAAAECGNPLEEGSLCEALYKKTGMIYPIKGGWGTSLKDAIVILGGGLNMEYVLMSRMFPGCDIEKQELLVDGDRHYDVILFSNKQGEEFKVCFDITKFYGV